MQASLKRNNLVAMRHGQLPISIGLFVVAVAACSPIWVWCAHRMTDGSDDPFGLFAAIACFALALNAFFRSRQNTFESGSIQTDSTRTRSARSNNQQSSSYKTDSAAIVLLLFSAYALTGGVIPMLVRAGFAATALAIMISQLAYNRRLHLPTLSLILLALPIVATMQFYLGYPMRLLVAHVVALLANGTGFPVHLQGTDLNWECRMLGIDPACSGVRMLWTSFFVCFVAAALNRLSNSRTIVLAFATLLFALTGNVIRAANLFLIDVVRARTSLAIPEFMHPGIGIILFAVVTAAILFTAKRLAVTTSSQKTSAPQQAFAPQRIFAPIAPRLPFAWAKPLTVAPTALANALIAAAVLLASTQICAAGDSFAETQSSRPAIPLSVLTQGLSELPLKPVALSSGEQIFAESFPGSIAKFSNGRSQFIVRSVAQPTRRLHPAEDCFRGLGYKVATEPNFHDSTGAWGVFSATKEQMQIDVREQISDLNGNNFPDVSAWYWSALLGKTHGPWRSVTIATPVSNSSVPGLAISLKPFTRR